MANPMKVILKLTSTDIKKLKPYVDEIRFEKGIENFVSQYNKVYKDLMKVEEAGGGRINPWFEKTFYS